jgi:hypothetical protein
MPRSLDPLPGESLAGYLLRLSFRLGVPPGQVAAVTGLTPRAGTIPASRMLILDDAVTRAFAEATRLAPAEVTALTLAGLGGRYPPACLGYLGRQRQPSGIFIKEAWVMSRSTRYCPQCLAGHPAAPVQQQLGGAWDKLWRLPVIFACPQHQRLLEHACPACGQPAHLRATHGGQPSLIPMPEHAAIHPAACRHPQAAGGTARRRQLRPCGHLLTEGHAAPGPEPPDGLRQSLQFQQHLLELLDPHGPAATTSGGEPATPGQYFTDLRILACLITITWPAARGLATPWQARLISQHAGAARRQASATAESRAQHRQITYHDTPPLEAATCAALLTLAGDILASATPRSLSQAVRHLTGPAAVPAFQRWVKWFLAGDGHCSPALRAATGPAVGALHVIRQATAGGVPRMLHPPPRPAAGYSIAHVPAYLPAQWHEEHLARLTGLAPEQLLRRAAALRLARTCTPASYRKLGELLRIPPDSAKNAVKTVHNRLAAAGQRAEFDTAIEALAGTLDTAQARTDYGRRRSALQDWVISPAHWSQLISGLPARCSPRADWGQRKRMLASAWVWARVTGGEHLFAPAVMTDPAAPRSQRPGGRERLNYIDLLWPHLATWTTGQYAELRHRLNDYADQMAARIDANGQLTCSVTECDTQL